MMTIPGWRAALVGSAALQALSALYGEDAPRQQARYRALLDAYCASFGDGTEISIFSAPGRSEIGGNHTDHQNGRVLAAAVTLDAVACAAKADGGVVAIRSEGYDKLALALDSLSPRVDEQNASASLVRGVAAYFAEHGYRIGGFSAAVASDVPKGSGLSSSAAYGVLIGTILSGLYNGGGVAPAEIAKAAKFAENRYFYKPSGLMDQLASAVGGFLEIDFSDREYPAVARVDRDIGALGYALCVVSTGGSHADLTDEYASIPAEMGSVARCFGCEVLGNVDERVFHTSIGTLRGRVTDRALLRAMHFFAENARVPQQAAALRGGDMERFIRLMRESGRSSFELLQNVCPRDEAQRGLALALALSDRFIGARGACRVHGGGFAGTILALLPQADVSAYAAGMERVFGEGCCRRLNVRYAGSLEIKL